MYLIYGAELSCSSCIETTKPIDHALEFGYHSVESVFLKWEVSSVNILDTDFAHKVANMYL